MIKSTAFISMLTVVMLTLVFVSQNRASGSLDDDCPIATLTWHSPASPDSCDLKTYVYDDSVANDGFSTTMGVLGNYIPIADYTSGEIKSIDMCFFSDSTTTAQSCVVYFYKTDQTTIFGQSDPFINTGAAWPDTTWINVPCPDIPYTGPFYAMVDYSEATVPIKNYFAVDQSSTPPGYPLGLAYAVLEGTWYLISDFSDCCPATTFLQHVNVCENDAVGIKELYPGSISLYPNPANEIVNIVSTSDIRSIEVLDFIGQTIYK
ncbi:MAG: hypothetical protein ABSD71_15265, partial [Bacteroidales bacterium]